MVANSTKRSRGDRAVFELSSASKAALQAESARTGAAMSFILRGLVDAWAAGKANARAKHGVTAAARRAAKPAKTPGPKKKRKAERSRA